MKKIFSALVALSMILSMTAFAATNAKLSVTASATSVKAGDEIIFTVKSTGDGDMSFYGATIKFEYDETQLAIDKGSFAADIKLSGMAAVSTSAGTVTIQNSPKAADDAANYIAGKLKGNFMIGQFKATVLDTAVAGSTIKFNVKAKQGVNVTYANVVESGTSIKAMNQSRITSIDSMPEAIIVAGDDPTPSKPVITLDPSNPVTGENNGIVDINTNAETGAYSVKVTAPIGKKAVIYINGEAQTGSEIAGTATKDITIKVAYEDVTDEVITYVVPMSSIYGAADGIAAFGKGTIAEGVEYGIKFGGLTGTYKDITDYKFPAKGNVGGIFGVEVKDAPAGNYTAQAYVDDAMGAAIDFTK